MHDTEYSLSSVRLDEYDESRHRRQWQQIPSWCSRRISPVTAHPSQVPWPSRYEVLQVEPGNNEYNGSSSLEVSLRLNQPMPCIETSFIKQKVLSLPQETVSICSLNLLSEVCWLPRACIEEVKRKLPTWVQPSDHCPLFQVGSNEVTRSLRTIKRNFEMTAKGSGAQ